MRQPRGHPDRDPGWPDLDRPSRQARIQGFLERHPRSFSTVLTALFVYVSIGTVLRLAQSHATVRDGWLLAVTLGLAIPIALMILVGMNVRRPYSRPSLGSLLALLACFLLGFFLNEPLVFSGWTSISYQVTTALQAGALALFVPIDLVLTAGLICLTFLVFAGRRLGLIHPAMKARSEQGRDVR
jgi:hypothetical protein